MTVSFNGAGMAVDPRWAMGDSSIVRVGLDAGRNNMVLQSARRLGDLVAPTTRRLPSLVALAGDPPELLVGHEVLANRHEAAPLHPLDGADTAVLERLGDRLRAKLDPAGDKQLWAVINAGSEEEKRIRVIAHHIFDRVCFLDPALLMATSLGSNEVARHSIWIDLGTNSVRIAPVHGGSPDPGATVVVPGGGRAIDERLQEALRTRFPDLLLTDVTVTSIKERFAHVHPEELPCNLRVSFRGSEQVIEIGTHVRRACEPLVGEILKGLSSVVASCPSDSVEEMLGNIIVAGGGARMRGIETRLRDEVREFCGPAASVRLAEDPTTLIANGALRWAHFLREDQWGVPLFSFSV
jgi:hypothetical protein